uniref:Retrotransposon gag domain-containing protein n=1 Tax=Kryptolebias marmoratus TaxID=37003 RepID=A0A3Q3EDV5_KRYMA
MWGKTLPKIMTEHSDPTPGRTDALRRTVSEQQQQLLSHENALKAILDQLQEQGRQIQFIAGAVSQPTPSTSPGPSGGAVSTPVIQPTVQARDVVPPNPDKFSGEVGECGGFLLQCSIAFNRSPQSFTQDRAKISFILSLLTGKALQWAEARFSNINDYGCSFDEFLVEFKQTFAPTRDRTSDSRRLWSVRQRDRPISDFIIEFHTLAAATGSYCNPPGGRMEDGI